MTLKEALKTETKENFYNSETISLHTVSFQIIITNF